MTEREYLASEGFAGGVDSIAKYFVFRKNTFQVLLGDTVDNTPCLSSGDQ
jgi:hypothetical protein